VSALWIKICGVTSTDAVDAALFAGADAIGFVFAPSVRRVTPAHARALAVRARGRLRCVAVTRHPTAEEIREILGSFGPDILQTDAEDFASFDLPESVERLPVARMGSALPATLPPKLLVEGRRSGVGETIDWNAARALAVRTQLVLAGGLEPLNVRDAIRVVRPWGVDVSTGVEVAPGLKRRERIVEFVAAARAAAEEQ